MIPGESNSPFQIITYRSKKRTVRFLVSPSVIERIPFIEEVLMRAAAGNFADIRWPDSVTISADDDKSVKQGDALHVIFPGWLFDKVAEACQEPRRYRDWLLDRRGVQSTSWSFAWNLSHYLAYRHCSELPQIDVAMFLHTAISFPIGYRPIGTIIRGTIALPIVLPLLLVPFIGSFLLPRNKRLLYAKARIQKALDRCHGLNDTRRRLLELGEPEEKLKEFVLTPYLTVVEDGEKDKPRE